MSKRAALGMFGVLTLTSAAFLTTNGFGTRGSVGVAQQRAVSAGSSFTLTSSTATGDPGGTSITESVNDMYAGDFRERLITLTPGAGLSPGFGIRVSAVVSVDNTSTPIATVTQAGDAMSLVQGSNANLTPGQPGTPADAGQSGLYVEVYSCPGTWSSVAGAVASATDDRDYTCSTGANGTLMADYDVPTSGPSPTEWAIPGSSSAQTFLLRTRFTDDGTTDGRQNTLLQETATITHAFESASPLLTSASFDSRTATCVVKPDATLWCWGRNWNGILGVGDTVQRNKPTQVGSSTDWANVSVGDGHACGVKTTGTIWCWGTNANGQLGIGNFVSKTVPNQIGALTTWASVSAGLSSSCARKTDSTIWCWGDNANGQLGRGNNTASTSPVQAGAATTWTSVEVGTDNACGRKSTGTLWCWGANWAGQLGLGDNTNRNSPVQIGTDTDWASFSILVSHGCATKTGGTLWCWGDNSKGQFGNGTVTSSFSPLQIGAATDWAASSVSGSSTCVVKTTGTLWCAGANESGQMGIGTSLNRSGPSLIAGSWADFGRGTSNTCGIKTGNTLWCWGANWVSQLGQNTNDIYSHPTPIQVGVATDWAKIRIGEANLCGIKTGGTLWCWGNNPQGQVGDGTTTNVGVPTQIGVATTWANIALDGDHVCAVRTTGTLWCWGDNTAGRLGDGTTIQRNSPTQVGVATDWATPATSDSSSCATKTTGTLWCWGNGYTSSPTQLGVATTWVNFSMGFYHTCGTQTPGTLWCWGGNSDGELGDGTTNFAAAPVQIGVATNWASVGLAQSSSCATKTDSTLWCWGRNIYGQVGTGDYVNRLSPTALGGNTWATVSSGNEAFHMCGLDLSAALRCWGNGVGGSTGLGGIGPYSFSFTQVGTDTTWSTVRAAEGFTCGSKTDSSLWCWGFNSESFLGLNNDPTGAVDVRDRFRPQLVHTDGSGRASGAA